MIQVIINADDYGHDENRTRAIQEAFHLGAVTATTAMANRPWFERAMSEAKGFGFLKDVGLHFNITEGEPLTEEMRSCQMLCDENGFFTANFHRSMKTRCFLPTAVRRAIRHEAEAQIQKYLDCGGVLMQLDSHHHSHTDFSVTSELYDVARKYGFKSARLSRNVGRGFGFSRRLYKAVWNVYSRFRLPSRVDYFGAFDDFEANWRILPDDARVEVMVHPLYLKDGKLEMFGVLCDTRVPLAEEIEFWQTLSADSVKLCHYGELKA